MTRYSFLQPLRAAVALAVIVATAGSALAGDITLTQAATRAKQTGLPMLVTFGGPGCVHCRNMKKRLETEPELVQLVKTQYVYLETDADAQDSKQFIEHYKLKIEGIPHSVVISAKGEMVAERKGAPQGDGLLKFLQEGIEKTGGMKVIASATPKKGGKITKLEKEKLDEVLKQVADSKEKLGAEESSLVAMVDLLAINRTYIKISEVKKETGPIFASINKDKVQKALLAQARMIDAGVAAAEAKKTKLAENTFKSVIKKYGDTPAAKLAQEKLDALGSDEPVVEESETSEKHDAGKSTAAK